MLETVAVAGVECHQGLPLPLIPLVVPLSPSLTRHEEGTDSSPLLHANAHLQFIANVVPSKVSNSFRPPASILAVHETHRHSPSNMTHEG